jgi:hypothetical protein
MESPAAAGERFVASPGYLSFKDVAAVLREIYPDRKIPKGTPPDLQEEKHECNVKNLNLLWIFSMH